MHGKMKRAHSLIMKVEADTRDGLIAELQHVILRIRSEQMTRGVVGGYSQSNIYSYCQDPEQTHDIYFAQLDKWLEERRESKEENRHE